LRHGARGVRFDRPGRELHAEAGGPGGEPHAAKAFRQPEPPPPPAEPELDVKELIRANADTLFTAHPSALAVARPKRITGRGFSVCVKAVVAGAINGQPQPITLIVIIERGKLADRRRATPQDGCAGETYEKVEAARLNPAKPQQ